jgi:hypothetical protein
LELQLENCELITIVEQGWGVVRTQWLFEVLREWLTGFLCMAKWEILLGIEPIPMTSEKSELRPQGGC